MNLVVLADDAFTFLASWEFMSLSSWALVMAHHRVRDNVYAGYVYIAMASFGTSRCCSTFGLLAGPDGGYAFADDARQSSLGGYRGDRAQPCASRCWIQSGLGAAARLAALAHPAAPSHVSALMSGVMTKVAVYGFVRIVFDLLGPPAWWWSMLVLAFGGITAVMGVLYALMQHDLKRLLAYHTVENIGIIFIGLGLALAFTAHGMPSAAALGLTAGAVFTYSTILCSKACCSSAPVPCDKHRGARHGALGGLIHRMPQTAFAFLVGCVAISALPPLNGFVSEWLTFQAILLSPQLPQWGLKLLVPAVGAIARAVGGPCRRLFRQGFGVTFLGRPRSAAAEQAHETDRFSLAAMFIFAALCLVAGILPGFFIDALAPAVQKLGWRAHAGADRN